MFSNFVQKIKNTIFYIGKFSTSGRAIWPPKVWPPVRPYPLTYFIEPSSTCNAACIFCHYIDQKNQGKETKNIEDVTYSKAVNLIRKDAEYRNIKKVGVSITPTTGEALVNRNWEKFLYEFLNFEFSDRVDIVSNGILMNQKNIDKLCAAPNIHKLDVGISLGGIDRETYKIMFQNDKFDKVVKNINLLFKNLQDKNLIMNVWLNLRVPDKSKISNSDIQKVFNKVNYKWATYTIMDVYKDVPVPTKNDKEYKMLKMVNILEKRDYSACGMLEAGVLNFSANNKVIACGCHYAQKPGDDSLVLVDNFEKIKEKDLVNLHQDLTGKRKKLIKDWNENNVIPSVCSFCQHYHKHIGLDNIGLALK